MTKKTAICVKQLLCAAATAGFGLLCFTASPASALDRSVYGSGIASGNLQHGGRYVVTLPSSVPLTAVELWYAVPSTGFGPTATASIARLAAQSVAASTPITGVSLGDYVSSIGGTLSIDVFPDSVAITALVPTTNASATVHLLTQSYFSPVLTDVGLRRAKLDLATQALLEKFDPDTVIRNGLFAGLFSAGPAHYPTLSIHDLTNLDLDSVRAFAERGFQTQRASLIVSGVVEPGLLESVLPGRIDPTVHPEQDRNTLISTPAAKPSETIIPFTEPGNGFAWLGPDIKDEAASTAMDFIADYLFHPTDGRVTHLLANQTPEVTLSGQFITLRKPGVFVVSISGNGSAVATKIARDEISKLATTPLSHDEFERARNAFIYHLQSDLQTPADLAASLGWYATEGQPEYAPGAKGGEGSYFRNAAMLSPKKITEIAKQFLASQPVTVTLQPSGQEKSQ